jgi:hypothetical protein
MENNNFKINSDINISIISENVILDFGEAKIIFENEQIGIDDLINVYIKYKDFLNTFSSINL